LLSLTIASSSLMASTALTSGRTLGLCAGLGAAAFIGYCFYFDHRRRAAPDFKKKLREKRRTAAKRAAQNRGPALPDFNDQEAVQRFFLQEVRVVVDMLTTHMLLLHVTTFINAISLLLPTQVQLGEELLSTGDIENGVEHLSLAVAVCGQPHSLLGVLQQTLPPQIYQLLLQNLDLAQQRVRSHVTTTVPGMLRGGPGGGLSMNEEDVE
jgi:import receptor subunit TOM20